ncbi:MAG: hypothetical protein GY786_17820 [Proteobacteria bacterium]|nr:hypothetical protein [Pseudomonadota bacterium]
MAREKSLLTKVTEQARKSSSDLKKVENDQIELVINVVFILLIQILIYKLFLA